MMHRRFALLGGLVLALAAPAGASSTPAAASAADSSTAASSLAVSLVCYGDSVTCEATASGGSGGGYSFEWEMVTEQYDADGYSWGDVQCYGYIGWRDVYVVLTDGAGAQTGDTTRFYCQP